MHCIYTFAAPFVMDWDGDGYKDLLIGDYTGYVVYYKNNGDDTFSNHCPRRDTDDLHWRCKSFLNSKYQSVKNIFLTNLSKVRGLIK